MNSSPAFQFYATDFLASCSSLTLEETGAHIKLLAWSWEHGPVPNDMKRIAAILGTHAGAARRVFAEVSKRWRIGVDGFWFNPRLERVREEQAACIAKASVRGKAGAKARWQKHAPSSALSNASSITQTTPEGMPGPMLGDSSPISDLQDPFPKEPEKGLPPTPHRGADRPTPLVDGREIRRHSSLHAWCDWQRGMCVPLGLHADCKARLGTDDADARLRAWYPTVITRYNGQPIGDDIFGFWRAEFAAWVGTVAAPTPRKPINAGGAGDGLRYHWRDECAAEHSGRCESATFHAAKMAEREVSA